MEDEKMKHSLNEMSEITQSFFTDMNIVKESPVLVPPTGAVPD